MDTKPISLVFSLVFATFLPVQLMAMDEEAGIKVAADREGSESCCSSLKSTGARILSCLNFSSSEEDQEAQEGQIGRLDRLREIRDRLIRRLHFLGTPKAATAIAVCYGLSQGISNFLWAFNWAEHAHASEQAHAIIQEVGGLSASAESFLMGALVPVVLYMYNKRAQNLTAECTEVP